MKLISLAFALLAYVSTQAQWTLIWSEDFTADSLNTDYWTSDIGGHGWGNNELQYYTDGDNISFANGELTIEAREEQVGGNNYTSAKLITKDKIELRYGKIQARIKVPMGQGLWPAFWMLGENIDQVSWPMCGEIDIMEHVNLENQTHGTMHWEGNSGYANYGGSYSVDPSQYHVYAVEWDSAEIRWFVDGNLYWNANIENGINGTSEFHEPFYLILNLAIGGNWPGSPNASTNFPAQLLVDYVRIYKRDWEVGVNELALSKPLVVYPNPASEEITLPEITTGKVEVFGADGRLVMHLTEAQLGSVIDVSKLPAGLYQIVHTEDSGLRRATRLVIP